MERTARARTSRGPLTHLGELSSSLLRKRKEKKKNGKKEEKKRRRERAWEGRKKILCGNTWAKSKQAGGERREGKGDEDFDAY